MAISRRGLIASTGALALAGCKKAQPSFTFANPTPVWWSAVPLIALRHGFLKNRGFDLITLAVDSGVKAKAAVSSGAAAMGVASTNAFTTSTDTDLQALKILASITQTSSMVAMVSRISEPPEMVKGRIGYTPGTISELYLIAYLQKTVQIELYTRKQLILVPLDPPSMVAAFQRGDIDVACTWEPYASDIASNQVVLASTASPSTDDTGDDSEAAAPTTGQPSSPQSHTPQAPMQLRDPSLYTQHIFAVASTTALASQRPAVDAALAGLKDTCAYIAAHRPQCASELESVFKYPAGYISGNPLWNMVTFDFNPSPVVAHEALLQDHQLSVQAGMGRASLNALSALTTV